MDERWRLIVPVVCIFVASSLALRDCRLEDYHYEYTQCDERGHRWRVAVPAQDMCTPTRLTNYIMPVKGVDCTTECESGQFLDIDKQECVPCEAGTYSSGSSARYDEWDPLPPGFSTTIESFQGVSDTEDVENCSANAWESQGSYMAIVPGNCAANLILSTTLVKGGVLKFEYQYPSANSLFHITVQNDQCQAAHDKDASNWPKVTESGQWQTTQISLKSGFNVIMWGVIGLGVGTEEPDPILLRKMTISGVAYSSNCAKCEPGTYSSAGAAYCTPCDMNTWSDRGAKTCNSCDKNTEYSAPGSASCTPRPPCKEVDYYHLMKPCVEGKTQTMYQWIQPMICNPSLSDSVQLPPDSGDVDCRPCNPGMHLVNDTCTYCPKDFKSDGKECVKCDVNTAPDYSYTFENWNNIPNEIKPLCESFSEKNCSDDTKWLPFGDHLRSHFARGEGAYLVLQINVEGFRSKGEGSNVGQVVIIFETICASFCQFVFLSDESGRQEVISQWENSQPKTKFVHDMKSNGSYTFNLAFQNAGWLLETTEMKNSTARIYSIEITNTMGGGARQCRKCPKATDQFGCVPCQDGSYIDPATTTCVACPPGTYVQTHNAYGAESCKPCGPGLQVYKGRTCVSTGEFTSKDGHKFNMKGLSKHKFVRGSLLFTSSGTQYYHGFNISLFGLPDKAKVICENNVTKTGDNALQEPNRLEAKICRSTMIPGKDGADEVMSTQSTSLGDRLVSVMYNNTELDLKNGTQSSIRNLYKSSGFDDTDLERDIQVNFTSDTPTRACPYGRTTIVSLRCDPDQKGDGHIKLPPNCADGTCDGCTFHFMWLIKDACPSCTEEDFSRVVGECKQGYQTIHMFAPRYCKVDETKDKLEETQACTMGLNSLPLLLQVAIPSFAALAVIFLFMICFFWRKNKKLEYRYMKLVESSGSAEGELPGVDSCALEEGEFDEQGDAVQIRDSKGARFFKKLTNKIKKDDAFDSAIMNERMPLT